MVGLLWSLEPCGVFTINFTYVSGISAFNEGVPVKITLQDVEHRISVGKRTEKGNPVYVSYSQIINIGTVTEKEVLEHSKNVIGRAAVGGLFMGPLGAIVGGLSGTGSKKKTSYNSYLVINYHPTSEPNATKVITFEIVGATLELNKFISLMKEKCAISDVSSDGYL